jgi:NADH-quinone oxidoreductase subunit D
MSSASDATTRPPALSERTVTFQDLPDRPSDSGDLHSERMELSMGPQHPATHGVLQCKLVLDGEKIVSLDPVVGYLHRGKEKHAEAMTYQQFFTLTDRLDYLQPLANEVGWALAVEKLAKIDVPARAQAIRTIICEFMRLSAHLVWAGIGGVDTGAVSLFMYSFKDRETLFDLMDELTGLRTNQEYIRIGGVGADLSPELVLKMKRWVADFPEHVDEFELLLTGNKIFHDRMRGVGTITAQQAIDLGITGPCLRACGVAVDLRRARPYLIYPQLEFDVPVGTRGDAYDRYLVRIEEMRQSARILKQLLDALPAGDWIAQDWKNVLPPKGRVYTSMEEMIHQFKTVTEWCPPKGEVYMATEAANGELGYYLVSAGRSHPYRVKIRAPSFVNLQALRPMTVGGYFSDVVAVIASLHFIMGECDR